jgi:multiple sugar transport system substrate-binding protein
LLKIGRKISIGLLGLALSVVTACGGSQTSSSNKGNTAANTGSSNSAPAKDEKVQLRWAMWTGSPEEKEIWDKLAKKVTEKYPNITVKFETDTFDGYFPKLQAQLASNSAPDIISMQSLRNPTFASKGAFEPLEPYIQKTPDFHAEDFDKTMMSALSWKGQQMAIPYDLGPYVLYYNKDIFDKNKVPYPTDNMTWDEFKQKAKATTKEGETYGFIFRNYIDQLVPWIWSNGGDYMNADATKSMLQEPAATEAIQFLSDLVHKDKVAAPFTDPGNANWYREQFYAGKIAMYVDGPWNFVNVRSKAKFNWDIAKMPAGKAGSVSFVNGSGFGISAKSKYKEEAWKAITVILGKEGEDYLASTGRAFPGRKSSGEIFAKASDKPQNLKAIYSASEKARPYAVTTNWVEVEKVIDRDLDKVWTQNAAAAEVTKGLQEPFDKLLTDHQKNLKQ